MRLRTDRLAISLLGQKDAEFFEAFANSRNRLGEAFVILRGTPLRQMVTARIFCVYATTRKNIGARCKTGLQRATCHQNLNAILRVTK